MLKPLQLTPTKNHQLIHQLGGFDTLSGALDYAAQGETGVNFYNTLGQLTQVVTYQQLQENALKTALQLCELGFQRNDRLAIIADTTPEFLTVFFACQYCGIIPCPLPFSVYLGGKDAYVRKLKNMVAVADVKGIISPENIVTCAIAAVHSDSTQVLTFEELVADRERVSLTQTAVLMLQKRALQKSEPAYIQFSSGSTAEPKGILVSQNAIRENIMAILRYGMQLRANDRAFSWLPFYHDMGLVGFILTALSGQCSVDYLSPSAFVRRPSLWLELMSRNHSTITYAPSFGYQLALQRLQTTATLNLSALRIAGVGGDMIRSHILHDVTARLKTYGFVDSAFMPSYGMAEATLAISMADVDAVPLIDTIELMGVPKHVVSCGRPLPGYSLKIVALHKDSESLPERHIGEICIKGPSVIHQYLGAIQNSVLDHDGFIRTGDLGYLFQQQLFITGRVKDLILIRGRNIWAQDVEWVVEQGISTLRTGDIAAISVEDKQAETLVVIIQCRFQDKTLQDELIKTAHRLVSESIGVEAKIILVAAGSLPFTSSGKLSRATVKEMYQNGALARVG